MGSESSIAEDEDEDEDEEPTGSRKGASVAGDAVWWSGPSSRSSRRNSFGSSAATEDDEGEEVTVSMPVGESNEAAVRENVASTTTASDGNDRLSQGSIDVSSDAFLQKLDQLDASAPATPPPSDRSSSEHSSDRSLEVLEMPTGVGPRYPTGGAGVNGPSGANGYQKPGSANGWKSGAGAHGYGRGANGTGSNGGGKLPRRQAPVDTESDESSSESESDGPFARRGRDARGPSALAARSQSIPRQPVSNAKAANRRPDPAKHSSGESDDDVPLAQRIPTALRAQKSIRVQDKAEREERRQKRLERMRQRAEPGAPTGGEGGIAPDELAKRLLNVQVGGRESSRSPLPSPRSPMPLGRVPDSATSGLFPLSDARSRTISNVSHMTRSRTHTRNPSNEQPHTPLPPGVPQVSVSRSGTTSKRPPESPMPIPRTSLSRSGTTKSRPSHEEPRTSLSRSGTAYRNRAGSKTDDEGESSRFQRSRSVRDPSSARPPMPPMPPMESIPMSARRPSQQEPTTPLVVEQRIYIGDRQKFIVVDVGSPGLTAKDIIDVAKQRGELDTPVWYG
ncbi:hypothetical protein FS749_005139 [Ceratobasidium sp. UAMH 11750]|nr:hypothetical protein FS749_005139 [Ceratobasidium sp. UAMH 11750]